MSLGGQVTCKVDRKRRARLWNLVWIAVKKGPKTRGKRQLTRLEFINICYKGVGVLGAGASVSGFNIEFRRKAFFGNSHGFGLCRILVGGRYLKQAASTCEWMIIINTHSIFSRESHDDQVHGTIWAEGGCLDTFLDERWFLQTNVNNHGEVAEFQ